MNEHSEHPSTTDASAWDTRLTIAAFFAALWLPLLGAIALPESSVSATENRFLAPLPELAWSWERLRGYPGELEAYYDDHMGFRNSLIRSNARLWVTVLGSSPSDQLIVGKNGWFFFNHPTALEQYRGLARFTPEELRRWKEALEERRDWLAERGIGYVLILAPNKHVIYPEFMPDRYPRVGGDEQHAQLAEYLRLHSGLTVVDLMPPLLEAKAEERVYHLTDTHWNDVGAYTAYLHILDGIDRVLPGFSESSPPAEVEPRRHTTPGMGLTSIVGLSRSYSEDRLELRKTQPRARVSPEHRRGYKTRERQLLPLALGVDDPRLPRAILFRDSFANALLPYLSENFRRILFVWSRDISPHLIEVEKPDVVLHEIVGRFIAEPPGSLEELMQKDRRRGKGGGRGGG